MKKEDDRVFKEAIAYERTKKWHLAFADKEPKTGRKFKCTTLFIHYNIVAKTIIKNSALVQSIEDGLYLISNPFESFHLCMNPKVYKCIHTYIGFMSSIPTQDTTPYIYVYDIKDNKPREVPHLMDKTLVVKILDKDLYYVTTLGGKAYYIFIRDEKKRQV
ncbi:MAG: hypothetical protein IKL08_03455 [Clostridia bacterium]|nr:hypothetical protein [Clostridia bacterium]